MARKRKSSVKAIKKKPPIKKKDKIEVEDNLSSITGIYCIILNIPPTNF